SRGGPAGRTAPAQCVGLWYEAEHMQRAQQELPEIKRLDLSEVVLTLKAAGVEDLQRFRWLDPPADSALQHAEELLIDLGALHPLASNAAITDLGRRMLAFPVHPRYSRMLLAAEQELDIEPGQFADVALGKCILIGFSDRVARRLADSSLRCELVHNRRGTLGRESLVRESPLLVVAEIQEIGGRPGEVNTVLG